MIEGMKNWLAKVRQGRLVRLILAIRTWFQENIIKRKLLIFSVLFGTWMCLLLGAIYSPQKLVYTDEQLKTKQSFVNGTGEIRLTNQLYSPSTGIIVLQFETKDATSPINRGIDTKRLEWNLYARNKSADTTMEIIPITDDKISVILKNVPKNFDAYAIDVTNKTVSTSSIDVSIAASSNDVLTTKKEDTAKENVVQFYVAMQNKQLQRKEIQDVSREEFALSEIAEERSFQEQQIKKLKNSIVLLEAAIEDDESRQKGLEKEAQYLTGDELGEAQRDMNLLESNIEVKQNSIRTAENNIGKLREKVESLKKREAAVKDGTFEFLSPIETVEMK